MEGFRKRSQCLTLSGAEAVIRHLRVGVAAAPAALMRSGVRSLGPFKILV